MKTLQKPCILKGITLTIYLNLSLETKSETQYIHNSRQQKFAKKILKTTDFLIYYLAVPHPALTHYWREEDSFTYSMLITAFFVKFWPEAHQKPRDEFGFLNLTKSPVRFELGTL